MAAGGEGMRLAEVLRIMDALTAARIPFWVTGGWGVDVLAGIQTRPHRDLDIDIDGAFEAATKAARIATRETGCGGVVGEERVSYRDGAAVRPRQRWTPAVHAALLHLRAAGFLEAPAPLGMDARCEWTTWIDGDSGPAGWSHVTSKPGLTAMARLLRRLHEAGRGFLLSDGFDWADRDAPRSGGTLCHGDFGPWNLVWRGAEPIGVIDWDLVQLGDAMDDVHYALEYVAPFRDDIEAVRWLGYPRPPERSGRIVSFWRAYTGDDGADVDVDALVDGVIARQRAGRDLTLRIAAEGIEPQATWVRDGFAETLDSRIAWSMANRSLLTADGN